MKYKNYYKILELKSDRVSDDEIKNAYRRLAKKYHPDINPGNQLASEKFKDVNEAYQILGSIESKKKYDRIHGFYKVRDTIEDTKEKLSQDGLSNVIDMMFGKKLEKKRDISVNAEVPNKKLSQIGEDLESQVEISLKDAFFGAEKKLAFRTIEGKMKSIVVKIPKGIRNGEKIRIPNLGRPGKNGGEPGDLYIKVLVQNDELFKISGSDLYSDLKLSPWEAALGAEVSVKNIDSVVLVKVPEGIQSGTKLRIANEGFWDFQGNRGDLLLNVQIVIPTYLSTSERQLFEKLSGVSTFEPRNIITKEKE